METWSAFRRLDRADRRLAIQAAAILSLTRVGLKLVGLRRWKALVIHFASRKASPGSGPVRAADARKIARIQDAVSRHLNWHANCLERSLALWWQLGRRGIESDLRIGARKEEGRFEAHAWVELGNAVLNDSGETHMHYAPFDGSILTTET